LKENRTLLSLQLGFMKATAALGELGNNIGDEGAAVLARALEGNNTLRELDVSQNGLTQKGVDSFLKVLVDGPDGEKGNTSLLTLGTASWGITRNDIAMNELEAVLARNQKLCSMEELADAAEAHVPKHVRDIYSVYRVE